MKQIFFLVEEAEEGGYVASSVGESIITEADTLNDLTANIREALICHFDDGDSYEILITPPY